MPTMTTRGKLLTARTASTGGCAACLNMPNAVVVFDRFDLEPRQADGNRLDMIAFLITRTSHQFTHPALPPLAHRVRKNQLLRASL